MTKHSKKMNIVNNKSANFERQNRLVAGIDIGASSIFVCVGLSDGGQRVQEFSTFTKDLKAAIAWLKEHNIDSVAMESTGVYWIPVYDLIAQAGIEPVLVNAHHLKTVPGRKTDVKDCQWIQQLHSYGLLNGSFRPDDAGVIFRTYVRQRSNLVETASRQIQLMHKALIQMNIQLHQVLSNVAGVTGMSIIRAIISGEQNPHILACLRDARCQHNEEEVAKALEGNFRKELVFSLQQAVEAYDFFQKQIEACENELKTILDDWNDKNKPNNNQSDDESEKKTANYQPKNKSAYNFDVATQMHNQLGVDLTDIPGIDGSTVMKIVAEIGTDMSAWPTEKHFASWLGLCPGNKISGGKILSGKTKPCANKAAQALRIAANATQRTATALGAFFRRMKSRKGPMNAITATAHKIAIIIYSMIKNKQSFKDIGQDSYEQKYQERVVKNLKRKAKELGYELVEAIV